MYVYAPCMAVCVGMYNMLVCVYRCIECSSNLLAWMDSFGPDVVLQSFILIAPTLSNLEYKFG